jgi:RNase P/RNase MRP subunit POP5
MVAEVKSPSPLPEELLGGALRREIRDLFGDSGAAAVDARVEAWAPLPGAGASRVLLRVVRERVDEARAALAALREAEGRPVAVRVIGVSGTLRGARRWMPETSEGVKRGPVN